MSRYEVQQELRYYYNHSTMQYMTLKKGDVVHGVELASMDRATEKIMRKAEQMAQKQGNERLLFFKAYGVVRYALAIKDLLPTRKQANIPLELE